jgi:chromosome partitioning protein
MNIVFANEKGGVGKSTLCALFANYLSNKGIVVNVFDLDHQKTLFTVRKQDSEVYDNPFPYSVEYISPSDIVGYLVKTKDQKDVINLYDTPANINDENILKLIYVADVIVIPFHYERTVVDSTALLLNGIKAIKSAAQLFFIPNKVKSSTKFDSAGTLNDLFGKYGTVTPMISDRVDVMRYSTLEITNEQLKILEPTFDKIYKEILS